MTTLNNAERARRTEYVRESKAALQSGESLDQRTKKRAAMADEWMAWFQEQMDTTNCADPGALMPDAFARLQLIAEDKAAEAVRRLETKLKKALAP
jgi:hypothetical protein